jgi:hypothetical protein
VVAGQQLGRVVCSSSSSSSSEGNTNTHGSQDWLAAYPSIQQQCLPLSVRPL